jgi:hypothetical protein
MFIIVTLLPYLYYLFIYIIYLYILFIYIYYLFIYIIYLYILIYISLKQDKKKCELKQFQFFFKFLSFLYFSDAIHVFQKDLFSI